jgi:peroxiredoxin
VDETAALATAPSVPSLGPTRAWMADAPGGVVPRRPLRRGGEARNDARVSGDYTSLPDDLPVPVDDGAADGLVGSEVPDLSLLATMATEADSSDPLDAGSASPSTSDSHPGPSDDDGSAELRLADLANGLLVAYVYPMTGTPGVPLPHGWDDIPGARGCTPQSCAYRDALGDFERLGATVVGISAQTAAEQAEFAAREHIPFPLLSDDRLLLRDALGLPTFEADGRTLYRRLTFVAAEGRIVKAFYPVFPPDRDAAEVLAWLGERVAEAEAA